MSMNNRKAVAARNRQREAPTMRTADNDQKPSELTKKPKREARTRIGITLAPNPIGKVDD